MANGKPTSIIEDSSNKFWAIWPTDDASLGHVWYGYRVKKSKGAFVPVADPHVVLVRKIGSKIITNIAA